LEMRHVVRLVAIVCIALAACSSSSGRSASESALDDDAITVGSFDFAESKVLAEIYSQALESHGFRVVRALGIGPREFVAPSLERGLIEFVPEYAGTATRFLSLGRVSPGEDVARTHADLVEALRGANVTALDAAPAQDVNTFVVTQETASRLGLHDISDLRAHAGQLSLGGPKECPSRPLCLIGLRDVYQLKFGQFIPLDPGGPATLQALETGAIDVALLLSTDPALDGQRLVALADDRGLQPSENVTPLVRTEVVDRWGDKLVSAIDDVSARLTTAELRRLDGAMSAEDADIRSIAADWLKAHGLT